ncbi:MAG: FecR family protein [Cyclobacteriaceae bacterium]
MKAENNDLTKKEKQMNELLKGAGFNYTRSKEDVWSKMQAQMGTAEEKVDDKPKTAQLNWWKVSIAASVTLTLMVALAAIFYTETVEVSRGKTAEVALPDGSVVSLNSESTISFKPLGWYFSRSAELSGEAFFEVEKGSKFTIDSENGSTSVLGTSFNIYSRDTDYRVFCETGKVYVVAADKEVTLVPGEYAEIIPTIGLSKQPDISSDYVLSWRLNKFIYNTTALDKVIQDIERQYDVDISTSIKGLEGYHYTGIFERSINAKSALEIICHSFDFELTSDSNQSFVIADK